MTRNCYCGNGIEISYNLRDQFVREFWAFCGSECLYKYLVDNGEWAKCNLLNGPSVVQEATMSPAFDYYDRELRQSFRSKSEAVFARWCNYQGIEWEYEPYKIWITYKVPYTPDFWLPELGHLIEVKGVWTGKAKRKLKRAKEMGFPLVLIPDYLIRKLGRWKIPQGKEK